MLHRLAEVRLMTGAFLYNMGQPLKALSPSDNGGPMALLSPWGRVKVLSQTNGGLHENTQAERSSIPIQ